MKQITLMFAALLSALFCAFGVRFVFWLIDHPERFADLSSLKQIGLVLFIVFMVVGGVFGARSNWKAAMDAT